MCRLETQETPVSPRSKSSQNHHERALTLNGVRISDASDEHRRNATSVDDWGVQVSE
jgi:hypothetical protein